ncbi:hypothetical protein ABVK25_010413 [Lepraria finkii]|uniref:Uncharacterized protein n=1 Tax=Lepraria finkii TaxID=1340010 RepID=A0ABR4AUP9_9LECA
MPRFQGHRTSILFLTSLLNTCIASPQVLPSMTITTPTCTYSYQETSEATIPPSYLEYNITHPASTKIIANITKPSASQYQVSLTTYKDYIQCEFFTYDRVNKTFTDGDNGRISSDFRVSDTNHSAGVVWSLENPAPIVNLTATAKSTGIRSYGVKYWVHVVWAGAVMAVLVL